MKRSVQGAYSDVLLDHYEHPRNVGDLPGADAVSLVHNPACGDVVRLALRVEEGRIVEARFRGQGCAAAVAAASMLTELLTGRTIDEALSVDEATLEERLGGVPPRRVHALALAREALLGALRRLERPHADD